MAVAGRNRTSGRADKSRRLRPERIHRPPNANSIQLQPARAKDAPPDHYSRHQIASAREQTRLPTITSVID